MNPQPTREYNGSVNTTLREMAIPRMPVKRYKVNRNQVSYGLLERYTPQYTPQQKQEIYKLVESFARENPRVNQFRRIEMTPLVEGYPKFDILMLKVERNTYVIEKRLAGAPVEGLYGGDVDPFHALFDLFGTE